MFKVKKVLNDLIEKTYAGNELLDRYQKFYVEMIDKNLKSKHGDYNERTHHIRVFNLYRDDASIIVTTIHELAHHIDTVNRGKSDHGTCFYKEYTQLLYAALDMNLFSKDQFLSATRDASDSRKVAVIIDCYMPKESEYKKNKRFVAVKNAYAIKNELRSNGYAFNRLNKFWEKEVDDTEECLNHERQFLDDLHADYVMTDKILEFNTKQTKGLIIAGRGSYEIRQALSNLGFIYKHKYWVKEGTPEEVQTLKSQYPDVQFYMKNPK